MFWSTERLQPEPLASQPVASGAGVCACIRQHSQSLADARPNLGIVLQLREDDAAHEDEFLRLLHVDDDHGLLACQLAGDLCFQLRISA